MDIATVESPAIPANPPQTNGAATRINASNAALLAAKSHEARKRNAIAAKQRLETLQAQAEQALPILSSLAAQAVAVAQQPEEQYRLERLIRTRKQLSQLDEQLEGETDPKAVKAICDAIARLAEVERILAGRPLPGSHRPSSKPAKPKTAQEYGPIE